MFDGLKNLLRNQGPESLCYWCGDGLLTGDKVVMLCPGTYSLEDDDVTFEGDKSEYAIFHEKCLDQAMDLAFEADEGGDEEEEEDEDLTEGEQEVLDMAKDFEEDE